MSKQSGKGLCMFGAHTHARPATGERRPLYGSDIAMEGFARALVAHGGLPFYDFFCPDHLLEQTRESMARSIREIEPSPVRIAAYSSLSGAFHPESYLALHEPGGPSLGPHTYLRSLHRCALPITMSHHTLSYAFMRPNWIFFLLYQLRTYDAIICSSTAARRVIEGHLSSLSDGLRDSFGFELGYRGRLEVIPLGVDAGRITPPTVAEKRIHRRVLGLPEDGICILFLGRLSPYDKADLYPLLLAFTEPKLMV